MSLKNKLKLLGLEALVAMNLLAFTPNKSKADNFIVNGKIENIIDRSPINQGNLEIDNVNVPINSDGSFSFEYDGNGIISHNLLGYNEFSREINGNYTSDSLFIQQFSEGDFNYSLFDIMDYMLFLNLGGHIIPNDWNWGFFEDPNFLAPLWIDPDFNNYEVYSVEHPDSTYTMYEVLNSIFLEPTRQDSMFGHHVMDSGYEWHYEVPDSVTNYGTKGFNFYPSYRNHTNTNGYLVNIEIAAYSIPTSIDGLLQGAKHEWMAHGVYFTDILAGNPYNPGTICGAGLNYDFSEEDLSVLAMAHNISDSTDFDWYGDVVGIPPAQRHPLAGRNIRFENSPDPFNSITVLSYNIDKPGNYNMNLYDISGRKVKDIFDNYFNPGNYSVNFDGSNLSSGVYFMNITNGKDISETKRITLIK